jgi:TamB, inner membrane protein subunit of TAM complex
MRRTLARVGFVGIATVMAAILGTTGALVLTRPGRALLARFLTEESNRLVRGSVTIGRIEGNFVSRLSLDSVVVRDTAGQLVADLPRLELHFSLPALLARQIVLSDVRAVDPRVRVVKHRGGRMNYEEVLRLGEGTGNGGPGTLIELRDLEIVNGWMEILMPWNPDGRLHTAAQVDSALAAERAKPGRRIELGPRPSDSLLQIRVIDQLAARFSTMRLSTPDHLPFATTIDSLAARISDPQIEIRDLAASLTQGADSLLFEVKRAALPNTVLNGAGRIDWPRDTVLYDFSLDAPRVDLVDLRWISPDFPALSGRGQVRAKSVAGSRAEFDIRDLHLADRTSRVDGRLVSILDVYRGLGFRGLDLDLTNFDLDHVRPYLDTLPLAGRLTGPLTASGFFDAMDVTFDWRFVDDRIEAKPESQLALEGQVSLGGPEGVVFHQARLPHADLDLRTVRLVAPSVLLDGRLALAGSLDGPWHDVTFDGTARHQDGGRPASQLSGRARLDTRHPVFAVDADLVLDSLAFDGIRGTFPTLTATGGLHGPVRLRGDLDRMAVDADVHGAIGHYQARGWATLQPPHWGADSLTVTFENADLARLSPRGVPTRLNGSLDLTGEIDSAVAPSGRARLVLARSRIREVAIDSARVGLTVQDSLITVDTSTAWWEGGDVTAAGTLGWADPHAGTLQGELMALTLAPFDSLAVALSGVSREDLADVEVLAGRGRGRYTLEGSLDRWHLTATARADSVRWLDYQARGARIALDWRGGRLDSTRFSVDATLDTTSVGRYEIAQVDGTVTGAPAAFSWHGTAVTKGATRIRLGGSSEVVEGERRVRVDSLAARVLDRDWRLVTPVQVRMTDSIVTFDTVLVATDDGSGLVRVTGDFPGQSAGALGLHAIGIGLRDVYALLQRDTTGVSGDLALDLRLAGTRQAPTFRGSGSLTGPVLGDFRAPLIRGVFNYEDRDLQSNLTFWRTGRPVLDVDVDLPLDLALTGVDRRQLPGPLAVRGQADSVDLAVAEAFTDNLRQVRGSIAADVQVTGTWDRPELGGNIQFRDGGARVPGLGVQYDRLNGMIRLSGDSIIADSVTVHSGDEERLIATGGVRLERLTRPALNLTFTMIDFLLMNVRDYLTLRARGQVSVIGPLERPVMTGQAVANNSVLYFSDLISKDIINLEDPLAADLVDTTVLRAQDLGAQFQSRFLDSLTIRDLQFRAGEGVWLRSNEANVQLEGRVTVNKDRRSGRGRQYRVSGELQTPRGTYTLQLGPITKRTFTVDRGTLRYFNTADLNAALDLEASYTVQTTSDEIPIVARITGTMLAPKLSLSTADDRTPLSERELVSLLVAGTTTGSLGGANLAFLSSTVLVAELQRALISSPNAPFDLVEIRPPAFGPGGPGIGTSGGALTSLAFGKQLSSRLFATVNAGACVGGTEAFSYRYLGATIEYRLHPTLRLTLAAEPLQTCRSQVATAFSQGRYQFAADLRWDRDY